MILLIFLFFAPLIIFLDSIWTLTFASLCSVPWRSYWTYVVIFVLALMFELPGLLIPCIVLGRIAWYFSPEQIRNREMAEREHIRANAHCERKLEYKKRSQAYREAKKHQAYTRTHKQKQERAVLFQRIQTEKAEKNNLTSQIINLSNVAQTLERDPQARAEVNRLQNKVANLKAQKIRRSETINQLYLDLHETKNPVDEKNRKSHPQPSSFDGHG